MSRSLSGFTLVSAAAEMAAHLWEVFRFVPDPEERRDTAEEMIDRAERRGAIDPVQAKGLRSLFLETETALQGPPFA